MNDIIIVGAGASGMVAAIMAARSGASVLMLEHMDIAGKKILATGNGRCNYTNRLQTTDCYRGTHSEFAWDILQQFTLHDTIDFFQQLGILPREKNDCLYPMSMQAVSVRDALLLELRRLHVTIKTGIGIRRITKQNGKFIFETKQGTFQSRVCVLACGGKAAKKTGSDGSGYLYLTAFGHTVRPLLPALVQLTSGHSGLSELAGVRTEAKVRIYTGEEYRLAAQDSGELQLTEYGISGIPVFQVSRYAAMALYEKQPVFAELDFLPEFDGITLEKTLKMRFESYKKDRTVRESLIGLFPEKLISVLLQEAGIRTETPAEYVNEKKQKKLVHAIKNFKLEITGTKSFDAAQTTAGGIDTTELTSQLESCLVPGLFFAGEMIDIDGKCGGYNLQWAWSSGAVAGKAAARK